VGDFACWQNPGAIRGQPDKIGATCPIDRGKCREHRGDQYGPQGVGFARASLVFVIGTLGDGDLPFALFVPLPYGAPQGAMHTGRLPELHRELAKKTLLTHIAAGALDLLKQGFGYREVLEESDNICKPLVKCQNIRICRFLIARVKSVEQCETAQKI